MKEMIYLITASGYINIILGIIHIPFIWNKLFKEWNNDMSSVSYLHSKLIKTLLWVVTFLLIISGCLLIIYSDIMSYNMKNMMWLWSLLSLFWVWRTLWQIIAFYKINVNKSKIHLKLLTVSMIGSFIFNVYVFSIPILRIV